MDTVSAQDGETSPMQPGQTAPPAWVATKGTGGVGQKNRRGWRPSGSRHAGSEQVVSSSEIVPTATEPVRQKSSKYIDPAASFHQSPETPDRDSSERIPFVRYSKTRSVRSINEQEGLEVMGGMYDGSPRDSYHPRRMYTHEKETLEFHSGLLDTSNNTSGPLSYVNQPTEEVPAFARESSQTRDPEECPTHEARTGPEQVGKYQSSNVPKKYGSVKNRRGKNYRECGDIHGYTHFNNASANFVPMQSMNNNVDAVDESSIGMSPQMQSMHTSSVYDVLENQLFKSSTQPAYVNQNFRRDSSRNPFANHRINLKSKTCVVNFVCKGGNSSDYKNSLIVQFSKTKMCPYMNTAEKCKRFLSDRCPYAHDESELKPIPNLYKTTMCRNFLKNICHKSTEECNFAHSVDELRFTDEFYKTTLCKFYSSGYCKADKNCRHAHGFKELKSRPHTHMNEHHDECANESGEYLPDPARLPFLDVASGVLGPNQPDVPAAPTDRVEREHAEAVAATAETEQVSGPRGTTSMGATSEGGELGSGSGHSASNSNQRTQDLSAKEEDTICRSNKTNTAKKSRTKRQNSKRSKGESPGMHEQEPKEESQDGSRRRQEQCRNVDSSGNEENAELGRSEWSSYANQTATNNKQKSSGADSIHTDDLCTGLGNMDAETKHVKSTETLKSTKSIKHIKRVSTSGKYTQDGQVSEDGLHPESEKVAGRSTSGHEHFNDPHTDGTTENATGTNLVDNSNSLLKGSKRNQMKSQMNESVSTGPVQAVSNGGNQFLGKHIDMTVANIHGDPSYWNHDSSMYTRNGGPMEEMRNHRFGRNHNGSNYNDMHRNNHMGYMNGSRNYMIQSSSSHHPNVHGNSGRRNHNNAHNEGGSFYGHRKHRHMNQSGGMNPMHQMNHVHHMRNMNQHNYQKCGSFISNFNNNAIVHKNNYGSYKNFGNMCMVPNMPVPMYECGGYPMGPNMDNFRNHNGTNASGPVPMMFQNGGGYDNGPNPKEQEMNGGTNRMWNRRTEFGYDRNRNKQIGNRHKHMDSFKGTQREFHMDKTCKDITDVSRPVRNETCLVHVSEGAGYPELSQSVDGLHKTYNLDPVHNTMTTGDKSTYAFSNVNRKISSEAPMKSRESMEHAHIISVEKEAEDLKQEMTHTHIKRIHECSRKYRYEEETTKEGAGSSESIDLTVANVEVCYSCYQYIRKEHDFELALPIESSCLKCGQLIRKSMGHKMIEMIKPQVQHLFADINFYVQCYED